MQSMGCLQILNMLTGSDRTTHHFYCRPLNENISCQRIPCLKGQRNFKWPMIKSSIKQYLLIKSSCTFLCDISLSHHTLGPKDTFRKEQVRERLQVFLTAENL